MRALYVAAVALVAAASLSVNAARAEMPASDFRVSRVQVILNEAIDTGAPSFNDGQHQDRCYLVYRVALQSTLPLLDDHPDLQDQIRAALAQAQNTDSRKKRAWVLRHAIDDTLAGLN